MLCTSEADQCQATDSQGLCHAAWALLPLCFPRVKAESLEGFTLTASPLISARRMLEDPMWLGKYLGFVEKFYLQKALVFNIAGKRGALSASGLYKEFLPFSSTP